MVYKSIENKITVKEFRDENMLEEICNKKFIGQREYSWHIKLAISNDGKQNVIYNFTTGEFDNDYYFKNEIDDYIIEQIYITKNDKAHDDSMLLDEYILIAEKYTKLQEYKHKIKINYNSDEVYLYFTDDGIVAKRYDREIIENSDEDRHYLFNYPIIDIKILGNYYEKQIK